MIRRPPRFTRTYTLLPSTTLFRSKPAGEADTPCAEYLGARLKARGFEVGYHRAEGETGDSARYPRTNVVARREGGRPGPCVHFNGHIDVVAVGHGWTVEPFEGVVRDGRVYGRGACDMKGGLAAAVIAVEGDRKSTRLNPRH